MPEYSERPGERASYRVSDAAEETEREGRRLCLLGELRDRESARRIERLGIAAGWRCADLGCGAGTLARWMAERVGPSGFVLATDVDLRFCEEAAADRPAWLELRRHDVVADPLPEAAFDLVHARALLQVLDQREAVLDAMVRAARPGGWVLVSDPCWTAFESQDLPPAFRALHRAMMAVGSERHGYDRDWASRIPSALRARGLREVDCVGACYAMHGGTPSAEWLVMAYERAAPGLVSAGLLDAHLVEAGLREARDPDFLALGPLSISGWGRKP